MKRTICRAAMAIVIAVTGMSLAIPATASPATARPPTAFYPAPNCKLTVARPVRLTYYIHAQATLRCANNVRPSSIVLDLGYASGFWGSRSVSRVWRDVPANVNQQFGILYPCPGRTGGTNRTWSMDGVAWIKFQLAPGRVGFFELDTIGPKATFRC